MTEQLLCHIFSSCYSLLTCLTDASQACTSDLKRCRKGTKLMGGGCFWRVHQTMLGTKIAAVRDQVAGMCIAVLPGRIHQRAASTCRSIVLMLDCST